MDREAVLQAVAWALSVLTLAALGLGFRRALTRP